MTDACFYPPPLLCPGEATSGALCPAICSAVQEGHGSTAESPQKGFKDYWKTATLILQGKTEKPGQNHMKKTKTKQNKKTDAKPQHRT